MIVCRNNYSMIGQNSRQFNEQQIESELDYDIHQLAKK